VGKLGQSLAWGEINLNGRWDESLRRRFGSLALAIRPMESQYPPDALARETTSIIASTKNALLAPRAGNARQAAVVSLAAQRLAEFSDAKLHNAVTQSRDVGFRLRIASCIAQTQFASRRTLTKRRNR
jgi:hypothetical protein